MLDTGRYWEVQIHIETVKYFQHHFCFFMSEYINWVTCTDRFRSVPIRNDPYRSVTIRTDP